MKYHRVSVIRFYRRKCERGKQEIVFCIHLLTFGIANARAQKQCRSSPLDPVLMFKVMFVQRLYGLSDEQVEYQIKDRTGFRDFLGIVTVDDVPDARTIWKYREELTRSGAYDELFKRFYEHLQSLGLIVNDGKIIDASFVVSPRQRNTREENKAIKKGEGDSLWNDNPHKKCHKDIDARWTKKGRETFYG